MILINIVPISLKNANSFVTMYHRHNKRVTGHKFSLGLMHDDELIGVAIVGRPIARLLDTGDNLEILRVCIKPGAQKGANSKLYARCRRIGQLMGFKKIITYTLETESQSSLKAVGARIDGKTKPQEWSRKSRKRESQSIYKQKKIRWELNC